MVGGGVGEGGGCSSNRGDSFGGGREGRWDGARMGARAQPLDLRGDEGRLPHAALVQQEEDEEDEDASEDS